MKVNFYRNFKDALGREMPNSFISEGIAEALFNYGKGKEVSHEEKFKAFCINQKMIACPSAVELTVEEAALIKKIAGESFTAGGYGQVYELLEKE